ncbi:class I SAM-dependent methyltransferase [Ferrimicrobium acidiphilum]|uniref:class I SAM-dependent methyltransferase n=1 Tax=Ferrimicrobium acidiphilum TaxID=121039 RepID=UPI0023EF8DAD|nr:class I SAM-dependent methyltransferase [Ferrimicrobium acidiphilum]MCL5052312.1 class I SAM-dependent methyltransferase [Gammaproteobacteria bacterium]
MNADQAVRDELGSRWSRELREWAIPDDLLAVAPDSPWSFDPRAFSPVYDGPLNRTQEAIVDLLDRSPSRSVLDVGAGAGACVLPIGSFIQSLLAVDRDAAMLEMLALESESIPQLLVETRVGDFFALEPDLELYDVVTSQNVVYNVDDLFGFLGGLIAHAKVGVVLEMTLYHPHYGLNLLWRQFHQLERPTAPSAVEVIGALVMMGITPKVALGAGVRRASDPATQVISTRRRLCLTPREDVAIQSALEQGLVLPNPTVTLVCEFADG